LVLVLANLSVVSCLDPDQKTPTRRPVQQIAYRDLTERDHVLHNLELSYNRWDITEYARLLDDTNFTFFFSKADYAGGKTPELWDRTEDISRQAKMFDPNYTGNYRVISIRLKLQYPSGSWVVTIPDQNEYPGETWYYKSVTYDLTVVTEARPENITFLTQGLKALFTVRQSEFEGEQKWRIVEWRDDVQMAAFVNGTSAATQESSWGKIKAIY
jgi:hypothetical protein